MAKAGYAEPIKMGYPVFWTGMMLGLGGIMLARAKNTTIASVTIE